MSAAIKPGFSNAVLDAQCVFRSIMMALARPGTVRDIAVDAQGPAALDLAASAAIVALCDYETPIWLDETLAADDEVTAFVRFHTGAPIVAERPLASFAVVPRGRPVPALDDFSLGTLDYPDRSTTVLLSVSDLVEGDGWRLTGPGVAGTGRFHAPDLPEDMLERLQRNHALFPRGVDLILTCGSRIAAIPRSTLVEA